MKAGQAIKQGPFLETASRKLLKDIFRCGSSEAVSGAERDLGEVGGRVIVKLLIYIGNS